MHRAEGRREYCFHFFVHLAGSRAEPERGTAIAPVEMAGEVALEQADASCRARCRSPREAVDPLAKPLVEDGVRTQVRDRVHPAVRDGQGELVMVVPADVDVEAVAAARHGPAPLSSRRHRSAHPDARATRRHEPGRGRREVREPSGRDVDRVGRLAARAAAVVERAPGRSLPRRGEHSLDSVRSPGSGSKLRLGGHIDSERPDSPVGTYDRAARGSGGARGKSHDASETESCLPLH